VPHSASEDAWPERRAFASEKSLVAMRDRTPGSMAGGGDGGRADPFGLLRRPR